MDAEIVVSSVISTGCVRALVDFKDERLAEMKDDDLILLCNHTDAQRVDLASPPVIEAENVG